MHPRRLRSPYTHVLNKHERAMTHPWLSPSCWQPIMLAAALAACRNSNTRQRRQQARSPANDTSHHHAAVITPLKNYNYALLTPAAHHRPASSSKHSQCSCGRTPRRRRRCLPARVHSHAHAHAHAALRRAASLIGRAPTTAATTRALCLSTVQPAPPAQQLLQQQQAPNQHGARDVTRPAAPARRPAAS